MNWNDKVETTLTAPMSLNNTKHMQNKRAVKNTSRKICGYGYRWEISYPRQA